MLAWISANIGTIIICAVLLIIVAAIIIGLVKDKKRANRPVDVTVPIALWQAPATTTSKKTNDFCGRQANARLPRNFLTS